MYILPISRNYYSACYMLYIYKVQINLKVYMYLQLITVQELCENEWVFLWKDGKIKQNHVRNHLHSLGFI